MDSRHHRELIVAPPSGEAFAPQSEELFVPSEDSVIDVLEEERVIDVERV